MQIVPKISYEPGCYENRRTVVVYYKGPVSTDKYIVLTQKSEVGDWRDSCRYDRVVATTFHRYMYTWMIRTLQNVRYKIKKSGNTINEAIRARVCVRHWSSKVMKTYPLTGFLSCGSNLR